MSKKYLPQYQKVMKKLRQARLGAGLMQVEAEKKLRKPQAYISKIERGELRVGVVELNELASLYNKPLGYFVGEK